jgi:hypothetical protein
MGKNLDSCDISTQNVFRPNVSDQTTRMKIKIWKDISELGGVTSGQQNCKTEQKVLRRSKKKNPFFLFLFFISVLFSK